MLKLFSFEGSVSPLVYALVAPLLLLSQNLMVALCFHLGGVALKADAWFWLLPLSAFVPSMSVLGWIADIAHRRFHDTVAPF